MGDLEQPPEQFRRWGAEQAVGEERRDGVFADIGHGVRDWEALGLNPHAPYFNSGVMLMDLAMWRSVDLGPTAIDYARRNFHKLYQLDQEALNAVVDGRFYLLDPIWNVTSYWRRADRRTGAYTEILEGARIRHFTGQFKPWLPAGKGQPHAEEFLAYYDGD